MNEGEETHYIGDVIAALAAVDRKSARNAINLVEVEYEIRSPLTNPEDALRPNAPKLHGGGNLLSKSEICHGDVTAALRVSAHEITRTFQTQFIEHMFLEPESCIALPENDGLRVFSQGQGIGRPLRRSI